MSRKTLSDAESRELAALEAQADQPIDTSDIPEITEEQKAAINADIEKMVTSATWKQTLETKGWQDMYLAGADFDAQLASDIEATSGILKDIGLVQ